jgi:hypothetical protein
MTIMGIRGQHLFSGSHEFEFKVAGHVGNCYVSEGAGCRISTQLTMGQTKKWDKDDLLSITANLFEKTSQIAIFEGRDVFNANRGEIDDQGQFQLLISGKENIIVRPDVAEGQEEIHCLSLSWKWSSFWGDYSSIELFSFPVLRSVGPKP